MGLKAGRPGVIEASAPRHAALYPPGVAGPWEQCRLVAL